jgi:DNA-binding transcriptional MerR regulator
MSETGEAKEFYEAAEAAFIRRRGTPFLLSPADFALLKQWRALGVPLEAIEAGIDEAFTRREERCATRRVNSLSYCRDAVLEAWERRAETSRGKGGSAALPEPDARATLAELSRRLEETRVRRPDLDDPLASALRSLARLEESGKSSEEIESSLARLDRRLAKELYEALSDGERAEIDRQVAALLSGASARMDPAAADKTARTLTRRSVRERLELPRLSLL